MGKQTGISWCDSTFSPWIGCTKVSPACDSCYAQTYDDRWGGGHWGQGAPRRRTCESTWRQPYAWNRAAAKDGVRRSVFCASLSDVFDVEIPAEWRTDLWRVIRECRNLDWLLLTKRPNLIRQFLPDDWGAGWPHVGLGTTVESRAYLWRVEHLVAVPAPMRFLSLEPLLGAIDVGRRIADLDWLITGGESGQQARPTHPDWVRSLRDQATTAGIAYHHKQWGEWVPEISADDPEASGADRLNDDSLTACCIQANGEIPVCIGRKDDWHWYQPGPGSWWMARVGKKAAGSLLDGREWKEFPTWRQTPDQIEDWQNAGAAR